MRESFWAIRCVWLRYFDVFRKGILYGLITTLTEPLLYLLAFGYGMGQLVGNVSTEGSVVTYRQFVFSGMVAQTILFQGFFEASYGSFIRMYYQRIFQGMATTPVTLSEVLWGELLWDASKGTFSASCVLLMGTLIGDFSWSGCLLALPLCFLGSFIFAALGLWVAGISKNIEQISYPQYLLVFPMFLFCGVFYPLPTLPAWAQGIAWFFPLTSVLSLVRSLILGFPFQWFAIPISLFWLVLLTTIARRAMIRRLVK